MGLISLANMLRKFEPHAFEWLHLLISNISKDIVETTFSAIARCVFQILPDRDIAGAFAGLFSAAIAIVRRIEELGQKSSRLVLYTAAREYFEFVPTASAREISASTAMHEASAAVEQGNSRSISISGEFESFSSEVVVKILEEAPLDRDSENIRLARIRMVLALVRQLPSSLIRSSATTDARDQIDQILKKWRATERSRSLQKDIDDALEANQQVLKRAS